MTRIIASASAALVALTLAGAPAFAQQQTADAVMAGMSELGMSVEGLELSEEKILLIEAVLNDTVDDTTKVTEIESILAK